MLLGEVRQRGSFWLKRSPCLPRGPHRDAKIRWPAEPSRRACVELKDLGCAGSGWTWLARCSATLSLKTSSPASFSSIGNLDHSIEADRPQLDKNADPSLYRGAELGRSWFLTEHAPRDRQANRVHHFLSNCRPTDTRTKVTPNKPLLPTGPWAAACAAGVYLEGCTGRSDDPDGSPFALDACRGESASPVAATYAAPPRIDAVAPAASRA